MKFFLFSIAFIGIISCKPTKEVSTENAPPSSNAMESTSSESSSSTQQPVKTPPTQSLDDIKKSLPDTIRLSISLISIGEGTDADGLNILTATLETFSRKTGKNPKYISIPWGREGEIEYYFNLNELNPVEQLNFISNLNSAFKGHKLVLISENIKNRFKR